MIDIDTIRPGDVVRDKVSGSLRLVVDVTKAKAPRKAAYLTFRILRRSWTNRMFTTYLFREIAPRLEPFGRIKDPAEIDMYHEDVGGPTPIRHVYDANGNILPRHLWRI